MNFYRMLCNFVDLYKTYLISYNTSQLSWEILLKKYHKNLPALQHAFEEYSAKFSGHRVADILIMPIQRIPRYIMLLEQLKKFSIPGTAECTALTNVIDTIQQKLISYNLEITADELQRMETVVSIRNNMLNATEENFPSNLNRLLLKQGILTAIKISDSEKRKG